MVIYQILLGNHSPATWYKEAKRNTDMTWLGRGYKPSRTVWYDFRDRAGKFIDQLHQQVVDIAIEQRHLDPSIGALDGSSVAACASRHRMVNLATLNKRKAILQGAIDASVDPERTLPKWVPPSEVGRADLLARIEHAGEVLAARHQQNDARPSGKRKDPNKIVVSLSDPDAPLGLDKRKTYRPLYTIQNVVDPSSYLIISYTCTASATDAGMLPVMIDQTQKITRGSLKRMLADGGYCSILDIQDCTDRGIELIAPVSASGTSRQNKSREGLPQIPREQFTYDAQANHYTCPAGEILKYKDREKKQRGGDRFLYQSRFQGDTETCNACVLSGQCLSGKGGRMIKRTEGEELLEAQRAKMLEERSKEFYALRGQSVELIFGDAKGNRRHDRFHGRGLKRAETETGLLTLARNLHRLDRLQRNASNPMKTAA